MKRKHLLVFLSIFMCLMMFSGKEAFAAGTDSLTDTEKNSSYGFFVWLSQNAETEEERKDAEIAAQILTNKVPSDSSAVVFNTGNIIAARTLGVNYEQLLSQTSIGAENDATSIECLRDAIHFVTQGNEYRAKENLAPLRISSGLMAMAEVDVNYQGYNGKFAHSNIFTAMENLAYRMVDGTWKYGKVGGTMSDEPYEGWYTEEKENYDTNNGGQTGHYETLTDRQGVMTTTGFGVRHRFTTESLTANDGKAYDCLMDRKYYSQQFSNNNTSYFYKGGSGVTPEKYEDYLNQYSCAVLGHKWDDGKVTTEPTCTEEGIKLLTCSICGETTTEAVPALGHKLTVTDAAEPTCTAEGNSRYYTCSECGKYFSDPESKDEIAKNSWILSKTEHSFDTSYTVDKEATCTEEGLESIHCSVCDAVKEGSARTIAKKDHKYGEWKVTASASCTSDGSREKVCADCGDKVTEAIPAEGHKYSDEYTVDKQATCTEEGLESIHCSVCDAVEEGSARQIDKTAHNYGAWNVTEPATCTADGSREKVCADCGDTVTEVIPAAGHALSRVAATEATTTAEGNTEYWECSNCSKIFGDAEGSKEINKADTIIPKLEEETDIKPADPADVEEDAEKIKTRLKNIVEEAKGIDQNDYTEDTFKALQNAITEAEKTLNDENATADALNAAIDSILDAELALEEKEKSTDNTDNTGGTDPAETTSPFIEIARAAVSETINSAREKVKEKYTEASYKVLEDAISAAETVLAKKDAKEEELKKAAESVRTAIKNLKEKKAAEEAEKKAAAEARETLNNNVTEAKKIEQGNYTDESYKALQDAIAEAEALEANSNATKEQLDAAANKIAAAKDALTEKEDPAKKMGADGTAMGPGASVEAAEAAIANMASDNDLPGAVFNKLQLRSKKQTKSSITITWKKVKGAKRYVIYGNKCGKTKKMKRLGSSTGTSRTYKKVLGKKLKKGTYYKFMIIALDKDNNVVSSSKIIHVATKGGKVGNVGKVTTKAKKNKVSIKKGKTFKLNAKQKAASKKLKVKKHRAVTYESTKPKVATVTKKGVIKAKKKGTCYVYAYAQNGVFAKIKVTIK